jgi:hypothetical protein
MFCETDNIIQNILPFIRGKYFVTTRPKRVIDELNQQLKGDVSIDKILNSAWYMYQHFKNHESVKGFCYVGLTSMLEFKHLS